MTVKKSDWAGFNTLLLAQAIEQVGDSFTLMTLIAWAMALKTAGSASGNVSLMMFWIGIPIIFFGPFAGALIDRFSKKHVLITAAAGRTIFIFIMAFLSVDINLGHFMFICVLGKSLMSQLFIPARSAFVPLLVSEHDLVKANSVATTVTVITQIMTYAVGGVVISEIGIEDSFFANVIIYVITIIVLFLVPKGAPEAHHGAQSAKGMMEEITEGVKFLAGHENILFMVRRVSVMMLSLGLIYVALTGGFLEEVVKATGLHLKSIKALGFLQAFLGAGLVAGVLSAEKLVKLTGEKMLFRIFFPLLGLIVGAFYFFRDYYFLLFGGVVAGMAGVIVISAAETAMQKNSPPAMRGRMITSYYILRSGALVVATSLSGPLSKLLGEPKVILLAGAILVIYGIANLAGAVMNPRPGKVA